MTGKILAFRRETPPDLLSDQLPEFRRHMQGRALRPRTIDSYLDHVTRLVTWLGPSATPASVTTAKIELYRTHIAANWAAATTEQMLTSIRCFCRFLMVMELLPTDPTLLIRWPRRPRTLPKPLTSDELRKLHQVLDAEPRDARSRYNFFRNKLIVYLGLFSGLRRSEIAALTWPDVDLGARALTVRDGKGGHERQLWIHDALLKELQRAYGSRRQDQLAVVADTLGQPILSRSINHVFERWCPDRGIVGLHVHRLRHSFATLMLTNGADIRQIQIAMGHQSLAVTERYLGCDSSRIRDAIEAIPGSNGAAEPDAGEWEDDDWISEEEALGPSEIDALPRRKGGYCPPPQPIRETCKGCDTPIVNHPHGQRRQFCTPSCRNHYYYEAGRRAGQEGGAS